MKDTPGARLRQAREDAGFKTVADAARAFREINQNTLTSHENGQRGIKPPRAELYGRLFGFDPAKLFFSSRKPTRPAAVRAVPVISMVSAGNLREQQTVTSSDIERWINVADLPQGEWVALGVEGDSMNRIADDGSTILVNRADDRLIDGKYYVFSMGGGEATFKRWRREPDRLQPYSTNPDHLSIPVADADTLYVFGMVRRVIIDL